MEGSGTSTALDTRFKPANAPNTAEYHEKTSQLSLPAETQEVPTGVYRSVTSDGTTVLTTKKA